MEDDRTEHWESAPDPLAVVDAEGRFRRVNRRWESVTGHVAADLEDRPVLDFVHPDDIERTRRELTAPGDEAREFEHRFVCRDGTERWLAWRAAADPSTGRLHAIVRDVTEHRLTERALRVMERVLRASNEAVETGQALAAGLEAVCDHTGWPLGHAWVPDPEDPDVLVSTCLWAGSGAGDYEEFRAETQARRFRRGELLPGLVLETGEPAWVTDLSATPEFVRDTGGRLGSAFAFPVLSGRTTVAVLDFFSPDVAPPDQDLLRLMAGIGRQLGRVKERADAREAEQRALDIERRFLSMMTHELRSPLTSIKGFVDVLTSRWGDLDDDRKLAFLDRVDRSAERMHRLVDDFLALARQHAPGFVARPRVMALRPLLAEIAGGLRAAHGEVALEVPDDLTAAVDADFMAQIVSNLIHNAFVHGAPPVEVRAGEVAGHPFVAVRDHGTGVPADFVEHLFKRFSRADRDSEGTGLGLSIARDLARAMGGELTYEPAHPGSRFVLRLPVGDGTEGDADPAAPTEDPAEARA